METNSPHHPNPSNFKKEQHEYLQFVGTLNVNNFAQNISPKKYHKVIPSFFSFSWVKKNIHNFQFNYIKYK